MGNQRKSEEELKKVAQQLRCPSGHFGKEMAERMYLTNTDMLVQSLPLLNIADNNNVLEIGHGNCKHLDLILSQAQKIKYCGLEMSELMHKEAYEININAVENDSATYILYDGKTLPFPHKTFDRILTINTLYFFEDPIDMFSQIYNVLEDQGIFTLTFQKKEFIQNIPFTKYNFNIYSTEKVREMLLKAGFTIAEEVEKEEETISKIGNKVLRQYIIIKTTK